MTKGTWRNTKTKQRVRGEWDYVWSRDCFVIRLATRDSVTNQIRQFTTTNNSPEWGDWKLVRPRKTLKTLTLKD